MENKFKVGDKVKIVKPFCDIDQNYKGHIVTIKSIDVMDSQRLFVEENDRPWRICEIAKAVISKADLQDGDIVTLRNGDKLLYHNEDFIDMSDDNDNYLSDINEINENLTYEDRDEKDNDIIKVERPTGYTTIFERDEKVKEMTLKEVCKELGYEVKIVKEEN